MHQNHMVRQGMKSSGRWDILSCRISKPNNEVGRGAGLEIQLGEVGEGLSDSREDKTLEGNINKLENLHCQ